MILNSIVFIPDGRHEIKLWIMQWTRVSLEIQRSYQAADYSRYARFSNLQTFLSDSGLLTFSAETTCKRVSGIIYRQLQMIPRSVSSSTNSRLNPLHISRRNWYAVTSEMAYILNNHADRERKPNSIWAETIYGVSYPPSRTTAIFLFRNACVRSTSSPCAGDGLKI